MHSFLLQTIYLVWARVCAYLVFIFFKTYFYEIVNFTFYFSFALEYLYCSTKKIRVKINQNCLQPGVFSLPQLHSISENVMPSFCSYFRPLTPKHTTFQINMFFFLLSSVVSFQVSWVRRKGDELNLITFGRHTYSSDSRYSLEYVAPNDWQLLIQYANERDEGVYECQIATHPPLVLLIYLTVVGKYKRKYIFNFFFFFQTHIYTYLTAKITISKK